MARNILILGASYGSLLGDEAFDGGSQRDPGLPEEDGRTHQPRRHRSSHQAARRGGAPRDLLARSARQTGRDHAAGCRSLALRSGWPCDAGAAIHQPHHPRSHDQDRRGKAAVPVDHEHAAACPISSGSRRWRTWIWRRPTPTHRYGSGSSRDWCRCARPIRRPSVRRKRRRMCFMSACRRTSRPRHSQMRSTTSCCANWKPISTR